jgi:hypothetical protein
MSNHHTPGADAERAAFVAALKKECIAPLNGTDGAVLSLNDQGIAWPIKLRPDGLWEFVPSVSGAMPTIAAGAPAETPKPYHACQNGWVDDPHDIEHGMMKCPKCAAQAAPVQQPGTEALLNQIGVAFGIGADARSMSTIMVNISNAVRRSQCLSAIERVLTFTEIDDGEEVETCPLNWGDDPDTYARKFRAYLAEHASPVQPTSEPGARDAVLAQFLRCAYPVAPEINPRGYNWCEAWLDEARAAALATPASPAVPAAMKLICQLASLKSRTPEAVELLVQEAIKVRQPYCILLHADGTQTNLQPGEEPPCNR